MLAEGHYIGTINTSAETQFMICRKYIKANRGLFQKKIFYFSSNVMSFGSLV